VSRLVNERTDVRPALAELVRGCGFEWQASVVTAARSGGTPGMTAMKFSSDYLN
jgi:hypothetical protein